ncbi:hypothetical protein BH24ACT19_BH24ACT19_04750 [soil metagenome]
MNVDVGLLAAVADLALLWDPVQAAEGRRAP